MIRIPATELQAGDLARRITYGNDDTMKIEDVLVVVVIFDRWYVKYRLEDETAFRRATRNGYLWITPGPRKARAS